MKINPSIILAAQSLAEQSGCKVYLVSCGDHQPILWEYPPKDNRGVVMTIRRRSQVFLCVRCKKINAVCVCRDGAKIDGA